MKKIYLPGINGVRGIAALLVVMVHVVTGLDRYNITPPEWVTIMFARHGATDGVTVFFVISGFLITYLLLQEKEVSSTISIKKFYVRRILRIWPVYYLYLLIVVGLSVAMHSNFINHYWLYYVFFAGNIATLVFRDIPFFLIHCRTLAIEEQFYLFWPFIFKYSKKQLPLLSGVFIALLLLQSISWLYKLGLVPSLIILGLSQFQGIIVGSIAALLYSQKRQRLNFCFSKVYQLFALAIMLALMLNIMLVEYFHEAVMSLLSATIIIALVENKSYFLKTENNVLNYLGKISYSLYLLHPFVIWIFLRCFKKVAVPGNLLVWIILVGTPLVAILLADVSYRFFESKFLKLKKRFTIISSANTPQAAEPTAEFKSSQQQF